MKPFDPQPPEAEYVKIGFADAMFSMVAWITRAEPRLASFQVSYYVLTDPHTIIWKEDDSIRHYRDDTGRQVRSSAQSVILVGDSRVPEAGLVTELDERKTLLPEWFFKHARSILERATQ